jgi:hypothetical protein
MTAKLVPFSFLATTALLAQPAAAVSWLKPWDEAKKESAALCAAQFDNYQLQAVCMDNEREGFEKMQNDFGLPGKVALEAKGRCERLFPMFQLQAVCMQNEKDGYDKMQQYR